MFFSKVLALAASALSLASATPNPESCTGDCTAIDPAAIRRTSDGEYFKFITFDNIRIYKASTLDGSWVYQGEVVPAGSSISTTGGLWVRDRHPTPSTRC